MTQDNDTGRAARALVTQPKGPGARRCGARCISRSMPAGSDEVELNFEAVALHPVAAETPTRLRRTAAFQQGLLS